MMFPSARKDAETPMQVDPENGRIVEGDEIRREKGWGRKRKRGGKEYKYQTVA